MSVKIMAAVWELDLPADEKLILLAFADHADHDGRCHPSMDRIAWKCGYSRETIKRRCRDLKARGLLSVVGGGNGRGDPLIVVVNPERGSQLAPFVTKGGPRGRKRGSMEPGKGVQALTPESSVTVKEPSLLAEVGEGTPAPDSFPELWKLHPRGSKKRAHEQYRKATYRNGKPPRVDHETLMTCLRSYVETELGPKFAGHDLERWIRDDRWEQELAKRRTNGKPRPLGPGDPGWAEAEYERIMKAEARRG